MRSMLVSLCFLAVTVTLVGANTYFVTEILSEITVELDAMPFAASDEDDLSLFADKAEEICTVWHKHRVFFSLSINNAELRDCSVAVDNLAAYSLSNSVPDYNAALRDCRNRLGTLLCRERFSLLNIL